MNGHRQRITHLGVPNQHGLAADRHPEFSDLPGCESFFMKHPFEIDLHVLAARSCFLDIILPLGLEELLQGAALARVAGQRDAHLLDSDLDRVEGLTGEALRRGVDGKDRAED